jgi:hypothetical protein
MSIGDAPQLLKNQVAAQGYRFSALGSPGQNIGPYQQFPSASVAQFGGGANPIPSGIGAGQRNPQSEALQQKQTYVEIPQQHSRKRHHHSSHLVAAAVTPATTTKKKKPAAAAAAAGTKKPAKKSKFSIPMSVF